MVRTKNQNNIGITCGHSEPSRSLWLWFAPLFAMLQLCLEVVFHIFRAAIHFRSDYIYFSQQISKFFLFWPLWGTSLIRRWLFDFDITIRNFHLVTRFTKGTIIGEFFVPPTQLRIFGSLGCSLVETWRHIILRSLTKGLFSSMIQLDKDQFQSM